jgi:hypothetical protein
MSYEEEKQQAINRFVEILKNDTPFTDDELREMRRAVNYVSMSHVQGMALIRGSLDTIEAVRTFDRASAQLIETTNTLTKRVLNLTWTTVIIAGIGALLAVASLIISWMSYLVARYP